MIDLTEIVALYDKRVKHLGYDAHSVGWRSTEQQTLRFKVLTRDIDLVDKSIMDIGCGFGDLYDFLCKSDSKPLQYLGIDISGEVIKVAKLNHRDVRGVTFFNKELMTPPEEKFDYAIVSGSLNYKVAEDMYAYLEEFAKVYRTRVYEGLLINLLSTKVDYMQEIHAHYDPVLVQKIFEKYFQNVKLIEGYGLYEFTIQALY